MGLKCHIIGVPYGKVTENSVLDAFMYKQYKFIKMMNGIDDIEFIFPQYDINWSSNKCKSQYNMYLNNTGKNKNRWLNMLLALRFDNMLRYKHFQFTNGVFKEHRTLLYGYLKKDGLLNTCFTSYLGYDIEGQSTPNYKDHFESLNTNRLSNFLLWQIAYTEIFFEKKLWPDFNENDYNKILQNFKKVKRNYGNI